MKKIYCSPIAAVYEIEEELDILSGSDPEKSDFDEVVIGSNNNQDNDETGDDDGRAKGNTIFLTYDSEW